ncbi:UNVERIFIED_CONTAM: cytochrome [Sesamum latifolium]|uniref:Cytochrome n=1 Tax=Sesamum latifolium TaxID=2727402 RepID=A0AAW2U0J2_9LAMI
MGAKSCDFGGRFEARPRVVQPTRGTAVKIVGSRAEGGARDRRRAGNFFSAAGRWWRSGGLVTTTPWIGAGHFSYGAFVFWSRSWFSAVGRGTPPPSRCPPGPPGWPVFGNMFSLGSTPFKTIADLRKDYGPVVRLRIGSINTVALLTADATAELFKNHDQNFAERKITEVMKAHGFHKAALSLAPYGPYWRNLKRVLTVELQVQKRLNETEPIRRRCVDTMVEWIRKVADAAERGESGRFEVGKFVFLAMFNMLGNLILSRDLVNPQSVEGSEFFAAMTEVMEASARPNIADLFPWLKRLDPQGLTKKMDRGMGNTLRIIAEFVAERLEKQQLNGAGAEKDFLDVLQESYQNGTDEKATISNHQLNIIILELFFCGFRNNKQQHRMGHG